MSDLAERLRASTNYDDRSDAADLIEAQATRIAELEAALRFYADAENWRRNGELDPDSGNFTGGPARAALAGGEDE